MNYLVTLALIVVGAGLSHATNTRCLISTPSEAFQKAKVIFVGKVISVEDPTLAEAPLQPRIYDLVRPIQVRFTVERVYLGKKINEIEIGTRTGGLEWGYEFKVGETYLVYAQESETEQKVLIVKGCGRTRLISDATEDLRLLDTKAKDQQGR
ncbi:MAG: hypothetical protein J2P21_22585 [Chloracidobacterium sp.]|nr:hypothetical protein [Chloracidobacterium sp.]